jgi:hypothetical protein
MGAPLQRSRVEGVPHRPQHATGPGSGSRLRTDAAAAGEHGRLDGRLAEDGPGQVQPLRSPSGYRPGGKASGGGRGPPSLKGYSRGAT